MTLSQNITLDIAHVADYCCTLSAKQGEHETRQFRAALVSGSIPYQIPSDAAASIRCTKPDGHFCQNPARIDRSDNTVSFVLSDQMLACSGTVEADLMLLRDQQILCSAPFLILVTPSLGGMAAPSENELLEITHAVRDSRTAAQQARQSAETAENALLQVQQAKIPTKLSELQADADHRTVTELQTQRWSDCAEVLGRETALVHRGALLPVTFEYGKTISPDGTIKIQPTAAFAVSLPIAVTPGQRFWIDLQMQWRQMAVCYYDEAGEKLPGGILNTSGEKKTVYRQFITVPERAASMRLSSLRVHPNYGLYAPQPELQCGAIGCPVELRHLGETLSGCFCPPQLPPAELDFCHPDLSLFLDGSRKAEPKIKLTDPIPVTPGSCLCLSGTAYYSAGIVAFYDSRDECLGVFPGYNTRGAAIFENIILPVPQRTVSMRVSDALERSLDTGYPDAIPTALSVFRQAELNPRQISNLSVENFVPEFSDNFVRRYEAPIPLSYELHTTSMRPDGSLKTDETNAETTGKLSVAGKHWVLVTGTQYYQSQLLGFYRADGSCIRTFPGDIKPGTHPIRDAEVPIPPQTAWMRVTRSYLRAGSGALDPVVQFWSPSDGHIPRPHRIWAGKKWAVLGDSLTSVNAHTYLHYHDCIARETGIEVLNLGVSGSGYAKLAHKNQAFYQRVLNLDPSVDVVTIFGSGNDLDAGLPLGSASDSGTDTVCGCINQTIDNLYSVLPAVPLGIVTPTPWKGRTPADHGQMEIYCDLLAEICRNRGIPCLDLFRSSNLRPNDPKFRELIYSKDNGGGTHPNEAGHRMLAPAFRSLLARLI